MSFTTHVDCPRDRIAQPCLGAGDGFIKRKPPAQTNGDRRCQRAAGSPNRRTRQTRGREQADILARHQNIDRRASAKVAALHQDRPRSPGTKRATRVDGVVGRPHDRAGEGCRLHRVRCDNGGPRGKRQQRARISVIERAAARRRQDGIEHDRPREFADGVHDGVGRG